ncbi:UPF0481 protein At3g47200-like [Cornus florida]|uniref:UPF0481 protein At3g47200-like n=1 Tax=Cornus florida TaxID=4283 RepID=UPI00289CFED5|nr:UPF0481 protein At3g47200-like [Cornus florida]
MENTDNTRRHVNERGEQISIDIQDSINKRINNLPPLPNDCSIFRIPKRMREMNEKAYTPQVVSMGPFHRGKIHLQAMEELKPRYLQSFLNRTYRMSLNSCIKTLKEWEKRARSYYSETIGISSDEFVEMMLLDGCFIIEVFWRLYHRKNKEPDYLDRQIYMSDLCNDMILLENQLPFFVLNDLFDLAFPPSPCQSSSFLMFSIRYFGMTDIVRDKNPSFSSSEVKHFVDLLRLCHLPSSLRSLPQGDIDFVPIPNATKLQESGIKFKKGSSYRYPDIAQTSENVLEIPPLVIANWTEPLFRNLMALEQFQYPFNSYIIDYIFFMDNLIDSAKDADLLIKNKIFGNYQGDGSTVATLFNSLTKEVNLYCPNYYFYDMSEKLDKYCSDPRHEWKATLKHDYFSTPWRTASTIAAIILLGLTLIQTICSVLSF